MVETQETGVMQSLQIRKITSKYVSNLCRVPELVKNWARNISPFHPQAWCCFQHIRLPSLSLPPPGAFYAHPPKKMSTCLSRHLKNKVQILSFLELAESMKHQRRKHLKREQRCFPPLGHLVSKCRSFSYSRWTTQTKKKKSSCISWNLKNLIFFPSHATLSSG